MNVETTDAPAVSSTTDGQQEPSPKGTTSHHRRTHRRALSALLEGDGIRDPGRIAQTIVETARTLLEMDGASLYWYLPDAGVLVSLAHHEPSRAVRLPLTYPGRGATGHAFMLGHPVLVVDYPSWPHALSQANAAGVKTVAAMPIGQAGTTAGVLCLWSYTMHRVTRREVNRLVRLTAEVAPITALLSAVAGSALERLEAATLADMMLQGPLDRGAIPDLIAACASNLLGADYVAVATIEADGQGVWRGLRGHHSALWHTADVGGEGEVVARTLATGDTIVVERLGAHPDYPADAYPLQRDEGGHTILGTPLVWQDHALGALVIGWRTDVAPSPTLIARAGKLAIYASCLLTLVMPPALIDRLRRQEDLRNSERRWQQAMSSAPIILFATDRHGIVTFAEGGELERLRLISSELVGYSAFELWARRPWLLDGVRYALAGGTTTAIDKDEATGSAFETWCIPLRDSHGTVTGMLGMAVNQSVTPPLAPDVPRNRISTDGLTQS